MLKDYIRALQTSFTTVTGLRDALIRVFYGVENEIKATQEVITADVTTTFTKDATRDNLAGKVGNMVTLIMNLTGVSGDADTIIGVIPTDFAPNKSIYVATTNGKILEIKPDGNITLTASSTTFTLRLVVTYFHSI